MKSLDRSQIIALATRLVLGFFFILALAQLVASFFPNPSYIYGSDYTQFYLAGKLFWDKNLSYLYPLGANGQYDGSYFWQMARQVFPALPADHFPLYLYPPAAGLIFAPLSRLDFALSFAIWKIASLLSVAGAAIWLGKAYGRTGKLMALLLFYFFALFSDVQTIVVGQTTLLFAFLPLIAGHIFWRQNKMFMAGAIWSLLSLKPQTMLVLLPILLVLLPLSKAKGTVCSVREFLLLCSGLVAGILVLHLAAAYVFGYHLYFSWLAALKAWQEHIFVSHVFEQSSWQIYSLAGALCLAVPNSIKVYTAKMAPFTAFLFLFLQLCLLFRLASANKIALNERKDLLLSLSLFFLPLSSFYMTKPDLCLLIIPLWLYLLQAENKSRLWQDIFSVSLLTGLFASAQLLLSLLPDPQIVLRTTLLLVALQVACACFLAVKVATLSEQSDESSGQSN